MWPDSRIGRRMDLLALAKTIIGSYRSIFIVVILISVYFDWIIIEPNTFSVLAIEITLNKTLVIITLSLVILADLIKFLRRFIQSLSFKRFVLGLMKRPLSLAFHYDGPGLYKAQSNITLPQGWPTQNNILPSSENDEIYEEKAEIALSALDSLLTDGGKDPYFNSSGAQSDLANTRFTFVLLNKDVDNTKEKVIPFSGFGYFHNTRKSGNTLFLTLFNENNFTNAIDVSNRLSPRRAIAACAEEYTDIYLNGRYFHVYFLFNFRFSLLRLGWRTQRALMAIENAAIDENNKILLLPNERVFIGYSNQVLEK